MISLANATRVDGLNPQSSRLRLASIAILPVCLLILGCTVTRQFKDGGALHTSVLWDEASGKPDLGGMGIAAGTLAAWSGAPWTTCATVTFPQPIGNAVGSFATVPGKVADNLTTSTR